MLFYTGANVAECIFIKFLLATMLLNIFSSSITTLVVGDVAEVVEASVRGPMSCSDGEEAR